MNCRKNVAAFYHGTEKASVLPAGSGRPFCYLLLGDSKPGETKHSGTEVVGNSFATGISML